MENRERSPALTLKKEDRSPEIAIHKHQRTFHVGKYDKYSLKYIYIYKHI